MNIADVLPGNFAEKPPLDVEETVDLAPQDAFLCGMPLSLDFDRAPQFDVVEV